MTVALCEASPELSRQVLAECLRDFADVRLTVTGRCMEPALREGDVVTLVAAARRRPRLGDVVLTSAGGRLSTAPPGLARGRAGPGGPRPTVRPPGIPSRAKPTSIATAIEVRSGESARATRSAGRLLRSWIAVAAAHLRALRLPRAPR